MALTASAPRRSCARFRSALCPARSNARLCCRVIEPIIASGGKSLAHRWRPNESFYTPVSMSDPIFVVAPPRSGGAVLAETLARSAGIIDGRGRIEAAIDARCGGRDRLTAADATPEVVAALR